MRRLILFFTGVVMGGAVGEIPERQPWREIVVGLYLLLALAGVALVAWAVATTLVA